MCALVYFYIALNKFSFNYALSNNKTMSLTRNYAVLCPLRATRRSRRNPIASMTQA
jgi:hypothetical protein